MPRVRRLGQPIVEMNLIPLIDVSLILVIIFMVLTPVLIQSQLTVKLPESSTGAPPQADTTVEVQISREGVVTIEGRPVPFARLEKELSLRLGSASKRSLLVQADRTVPIERIVRVLDVAKRLGVGKLGIGVTPPAGG
ncbi:MAG: biopolymer transporter ExbD [Elusimicrobia bacterium]|nr:biopolymer transporter ExbD [Elusimicrobiota bacterium]